MVFEIGCVPFVVTALLAKGFEASITLNLFSFIEHFVPETSWLLLSAISFGFEIVLASGATLLDFILNDHNWLRGHLGFYG